MRGAVAAVVVLLVMLGTATLVHAQAQPGTPTAAIQAVIQAARPRQYNWLTNLHIF
jgi:hypothetical protein